MIQTALQQVFIKATDYCPTYHNPAHLMYQHNQLDRRISF